MSRLLLAYSVPAVLLLLVAFLPDLDGPLAPNATVQLGSTFAVFWLLMSLALVGVVQGFLWPHSGVSQAVIVGGLVVATQGLLSWAKVDASWQNLQLALYLDGMGVRLPHRSMGWGITTRGRRLPTGRSSGDYRRRESVLCGGPRGRITGEV